VVVFAKAGIPQASFSAVGAVYRGFYPVIRNPTSHIVAKVHGILVLARVRPRSFT